MSTSAEIRHHIHEIEVSCPLTELTVPSGCSGVAFVLRLNGCPVGFLMEEMPEGTRLGPEDLAARILKGAGQQILSERIYLELKGDAAPAAMPTLDIAICTHNRPDALLRCLNSLCALGISGAGRIRVLVIDNAPSDNRTREVVQSLFNRGFDNVRYILEPKPGLDFARNRALKESEHELLAFIDDDVVVDQGWLDGIRDAWSANPDAAAVTGPILPFELETRAQVVFEQMGGFGKSFERVRFSSVLPDVPTYPIGAGIFGAGANMVFRRAALLELGGFDDALDTGAPLPGGGDLDIFYRIIRAGLPLVREPKVLVFHQHRREYPALRRQMWTWGLGTMACIAKIWRHETEQRPKIRRWLLWWLSYQLSKVLAPQLRRNRAHWPFDMVAVEVLGAIVGICGEYDRSLARVERLRRQFA
jgi:glycosyltransferase involved in cell wall biosynthesis